MDSNIISHYSFICVNFLLTLKLGGRPIEWPRKRIYSRRVISLLQSLQADEMQILQGAELEGADQLEATAIPLASSPRVWAERAWAASGCR